MSDSSDDLLSADTLSLVSSRNSVIDDSSADQLIDLLVFMRQHERQYCSFSPHCLFVRYYRAVAANICEMCLYFSYSISTCMVALQYFCRVCSALDVGPSDLNAISVVCVILAAKYEERSSKIPSYSNLLHFIPNEFKSAKSLARWELRVLSVLQWELHCNTAAHFLNLLLSVLRTSLGSQFNALQTLALDSLQSLLLWYPTILTRPSLLAAGVIAAARRMLGVRMWDEELERMTGYRVEDVESMLKYLCRYCKLNLCSKLV